MGYLEIDRKDLYLCFWLEKGQEARLLKISSQKGEWNEEKEVCRQNCRIVEIQISGGRNYSYRGARNFYDVPQVKLEYIGHEWRVEEDKEILLIRQNAKGMEVETRFCFYSELPAFCCESEVVNTSDQILCLEGVTSFSYGNIDSYQDCSHDPGKNLQVCYARNTWSAECRWIKQSLKEAGILPYGNLCYDRFRVGNHTGMSSGEYLPEGAVYNLIEDETLLWQIEHNGSWSWELGCVTVDYSESFMERQYAQSIYLQLSGPQMEGAFWQKRLSSGERFVTVPAAVVVSKGKLEKGLEVLTQYRRKKKRIEKLPVIFNDYMNGLMGNSSTILLKPYIEKAAKAGCEIFVVDCGWYDSGNWQFTFGTYEECKERYPEGLAKVMDEIRSHGMKPGLWLELESFGIDDENAGSLPKEWLFCRNGKPLVDSGRYHLDFRNPEVREYASDVVARVIKQYGLSYLKIDYNLYLSWGTDLDSDSPGDGLLEHNRAYLLWLDKEIEKYPYVMWENCSSGGLRMDYALLSRMDLQSVSDQEDYRKMAVIASNCASAVLPEQAGIWAYPRRDGGEDETVVNMVSAMLFRIHLGGHLPELSETRFELVQEAIQYYKRIRKDIPVSFPYWPLGLHDIDAEWLCWGLTGSDTEYLAVIRRQSAEESLSIPLQKEIREAKVVYPVQNEVRLQIWDNQHGIIISLKRCFSACIIEIN